MLVFLSHRRLKPGSWDEYRQAWEPEQQPDDLVETIYHARSLENPDEIISFGIIDISPHEVAALMEKFGGEEAEAKRQARMAEFVEWTGVDTTFEVIEVIETQNA